MSKTTILKWIIAGLMFSNLLLIFGGFFSNSKHRKIQPRQLIIEKLKFDETQILQYDELIKDHQKSIQALDKQIHRTKSKLISQLKVDSLSSNEDLIISEIASLHKKIEKTHMNHFREIKKICNPNQALKLDSIDLNKIFFKRKRRPKHPKK
jgi:hypothetical protein